MTDAGVAEEEDLETQLAEFLDQGKQAAREGNMPRAYAFFRKVTQLDRQNEDAWLWRAGVADEPAETKACLEEVLSINPAHQRAIDGLAWLREQQPQLFEEVPPELSTLSASDAGNGQPPQSASAEAATSAAVTFSLETSAAASAAPPARTTRPASQGEPGVTLLRCPRCGKKNFAQDGTCLRCGAQLDPTSAETVPTVGGRKTGRSHTLRTVLLIVLVIAIIAVGLLYYFKPFGLFSTI